ncbi:uncharacterized protein LOC110807752 [Carica papaya]|uniref:uncharacterized protein LOC110807752 n=1 Tax=Carica papaya TaxID=3649 RepID=UPI000B8D1553|nr:uncharacterized protein LOC110807752 [Carica papaya]
MHPISRARSCVSDENGIQMKKTVLHHLFEQQGQSPYFDNLCRPVSDFHSLIAAGIRGLTTNPSIFERAITSFNAYNTQFRELIESGNNIEDAYWELVVKDITDACKVFESLHHQSNGVDGYVSIPVSPRFSRDPNRTTEAAKWLYKKINCPNLYIKIPATIQSISSITELISHGISVNVTLIFCLTRYEAVIDAYIKGLEASTSTDLSRVTSASAFYISRVDSFIDEKLEKIGGPKALALCGKGAVAQAVLAYRLFQKKFSGSRWEALEKRGAKKQKLMWASVNVKNPVYSDILYVDSLIGPNTISTMPEQAFLAFMDHGIVARTINANVSEEAEAIYNGVEKLGIDWDGVGSELENQVLETFNKSFNSTLEFLEKKAKCF